jgi:short chain dehydrogenase
MQAPRRILGWSHDYKETLESSTAQSRKNNGTAPVVLITGALTGIGRATALAFAHDGARIVVSGRHDDEGQELVAELGKLGAEVEFLRSDVRHEDDVRSLDDQTVARFGRLDVAVRHIRCDAGGAEAPPGRRSYHHDRLGRGRACIDARLGALRGNERGRQDLYTGVGQGGGKPGHYGQ